jgi:signal transduction histidine kinase
MTLGGLAAVAIENARLFQQSDLIAEFVHELRTPLASLNAAAHLLTRPEVSEEQHHQMADVILEETRRLSDMASSFLDLARLESGRTTFEFETVVVSNLLEECARIIQLKTNELGLRFTMDLPPALPTLEVDRDKLKQVVLNLLSNAYKYNRPGGSIALTASVSNGEFMVEVRDTGWGISDEDLPRLFEKFYRLPGTDRSTTGTGLGLSISKRIVEAHGGRISVKSKVGQGTSFFIHLPLENGA